MTLAKVLNPPTQLGVPQADVVVYGEDKAHRQIIHRRDLPGWLLTALRREDSVYVEADWRDGWTFLRLSNLNPGW